MITLALIATLGTQAGTDIQFSKTKYEIFHCITAIDPSWSWFGKTARFEDITYSKSQMEFAYRLFIPDSDISKFDLFGIWAIDTQTAKRWVIFTNPYRHYKEKSITYVYDR